MYQKEIDNAFEYRTVTLNRMYKLSEAQLDKQAKEARYEMMDNFVSSTPHHTPLYKDSKNLLKNTKNSLADSIQNLTKYCEPGSSEAERLAQLAQQEQQILQWRQENQEKLTAWFDENADGKRDSNEKTLGGIKVTLLNLEDNTTATATTTETDFTLFQM